MLQRVDQRHQLLEDEVHAEDDHSEYDRSNHNEYGRVLQLAPRRPSDLFGQLYKRLFKIVNELSHLYC